MKICLVTPDIIGPIKNGGIGTYATHLAVLLKEDGHDLTVVFTSTVKLRSTPEWARRRQIPIFSLADLPPIDTPRTDPEWDPFFWRSWRICRWLQTRTFELVHFQDWGANGFHTILAKKTGLSFHHTTLCLTLHAPSRWCQQGERHWPEKTLQQIRLDYSERFCAENVDHLVSPSEYMMNYVRGEDWRPRGKCHVLQNPLLDVPKTGEREDPDRGHLVFFGRLEERKGFLLFCQALSRYLRNNPRSVVHEVSFIGKTTRIRGTTPEHLAKEFFAGVPSLKVNFVTDLDAPGALKHIHETGGIVFMPSRLDNFPYTLIECIVMGIPLYVSNAGGMPEVCDGEKLFEPTIAGLIQVFQELETDWVSSRHRYCATKANAGVLHWYRGLKLARPTLTTEDEPRMSVVISCFNHGLQLEECLKHLIANDYPVHEVLVLNDGSTDKASNLRFRELSQDKRFSAFQFLDEPLNRGAGPARNFLAEKAEGDWILFHDADNCSEPFMVRSFANAIAQGEADIFTCYNRSFSAELPPAGNAKTTRAYRPYGNFPLLGLCENVFGDMNFCIRGQTFAELGGFSEAFDCYEDWEFLLRASQRDIRILVIPESLYWYRRSPEGLTNRLNDYASRMKVLEQFLEGQDSSSRRLVRDMLVPLYREHRQMEKALRKLTSVLPKSLRRWLSMEDHA